MTEPQPLVAYLTADEGGTFATTAPEPGTTGPYARLEVDITRFSDRVRTLVDSGRLEQVGWGGAIFEEDLAAVTATLELSAFLTSVFGIAEDDGGIRVARGLRRLTGQLDEFHDLLLQLRKVTADG